MERNLQDNVIATNRSASRNYQIMETLEVGISLKGSEVKSIYKNTVEMKDAYVVFKNGEAFLLNCHIPPYIHGYLDKHEPDRTRKLLMHASQILRWNQRLREDKLTIIPLRFYWKNNRVKLLIAMARGLKNFDKRDKEKAKSMLKAARSYR